MLNNDGQIYFSSDEYLTVNSPPSPFNSHFASPKTSRDEQFHSSDIVSHKVNTICTQMKSLVQDLEMMELNSDHYEMLQKTMQDIKQVIDSKCIYQLSEANIKEENSNHGNKIDTIVLSDSESENENVENSEDEQNKNIPTTPPISNDSQTAPVPSTSSPAAAASVTKLRKIRWHKIRRLERKWMRRGKLTMPSETFRELYNFETKKIFDSKSQSRAGRKSWKKFFESELKGKFCLNYSDGKNVFKIYLLCIFAKDTKALYCASVNKKDLNYGFAVKFTMTKSACSCGRH
jgi:hypothetical protein